MPLRRPFVLPKLTIRAYGYKMNFTKRVSIRSIRGHSLNDLKFVDSSNETPTGDGAQRTVGKLLDQVFAG